MGIAQRREKKRTQQLDWRAREDMKYFEVASRSDRLEVLVLERRGQRMPGDEEGDDVRGGEHREEPEGDLRGSCSEARGVAKHERPSRGHVRVREGGEWQDPEPLGKELSGRGLPHREVGGVGRQSGGVGEAAQVQPAHDVADDARAHAEKKLEEDEQARKRKMEEVNDKMNVEGDETMEEAREKRKRGESEDDDVRKKAKSSSSGQVSMKETMKLLRKMDSEERTRKREREVMKRTEEIKTWTMWIWQATP